MEGISRIGEKARLPLKIKVLPYLMDHRFNGRAVLPAVEAMGLLAASTRKHLPNTDTAIIIRARFNRFLYLNPDGPPIDAFNEIEVSGDGALISRLITRTRSEKTGITRTKEHVSLRFSGDPGGMAVPPSDELAALRGPVFRIPARRLYSELVPFGPSYHNVKGDLMVSEQGAMGRVHAPDHGPSDAPLGSPFPFDASLHAACVWGQRHMGLVAFPAGLGLRRIFRRTRPGTTYWTKVAPKEGLRNGFLVDIWIYDEDGVLYESAQDVLMEEVSFGGMVPPPWVGAGAGDPTLPFLITRCDWVVIIELDTIIIGTAAMALSDTELERYERLGERRKRSYLGARLCCKALSRQLSGNDWVTPASSITTISRDKIRPRTPLTDGRDLFFCSVSHDSRFAIAVATGTKVGVDVEEISERAFRRRRIFMGEREEMLVMDSPLGAVEASVRIWSIKEAMTKALGMDMAQSWDRVEVRDVGENKSLVLMEQMEYSAWHDSMDNHLFTLITDVVEPA
ncbi:MAG: polyketide synthase dehydratase domain-containing protein [Deltaproteobacteria bacterium]|nr:polyketide synthase dehydratase domain-containing protein [Deltaproteobacteria bacterium]MBW2110317.1 polyketide synthase dehydratase domain-containing protein [Deltaproteobacteria bacterium]MBW2352032.1 polyketide synthase dehydratase domain-containing protein [Deltaproteobacteria bacterium]